jgi:hypothetical protein
MEEFGVSAVKEPASPFPSPGALACMSGALFGDFAASFAALRSLELPEAVFLGGSATALAAAWLECGGRGAVASFGGAGGLPAIEELRLMLHVTGLSPLAGPSQALPGLRAAAEAITGERTPTLKPVSGRGIFAVESGIHADGLLKDPELYEPYPPGLVGGRRLLGAGLHSGRKSLALKCDLLGLPRWPALLGRLLPLARSLALRLERGLTDRELAALHGKALASLIREEAPSGTAPSPAPGRPATEGGALASGAPGRRLCHGRA